MQNEVGSITVAELRIELDGDVNASNIIKIGSLCILLSMAPIID